MKKSNFANLKTMSKHLLSKEELKNVIGEGGSCTVTCSNGFVGYVDSSYGCSSPGPYWVCYHSGGPSNSVVSCSC